MTDIVERLAQIANAKMGKPMPECLRGGESSFEPIAEGDKTSVGFGTNDWATPLSALARDAIAEIMRLRTILEQLQAPLLVTAVEVTSGAGQSFAEIKREIRK